MEDVNLDGEDEYYDEGDGEFFDSDTNLNVDLEWPDSGYRADCLPLQETQEVLRRTYNMLEQEDRYSSYSGIGYRPGDEVFHILISIVFSIYLLLNIIEKNELSKDLEIQKAENLKLNKFVEELRSRVECQVCFVPPRQGPVPMCQGHSWPRSSLRTCFTSVNWRAVGRCWLTVASRDIRTAVTSGSSTVV